jgi:hypothetical protein
MLASWIRFARSALNAEVLRRSWKAMLNRLNSSWDAVGLRRDLAVPLKAPAAATPIKVRPIEARGVASILDVTGPQ